MKKGILAKNSEVRQTSSDVKPGQAGLVRGWMTTFKQKPVVLIISMSNPFIATLAFFFTSVKTLEEG